MRLFHSIFFFAFLMMFFLQPEGLAQSNESKIKKLSEGADIIFTGKVVDQKSQWNHNKTRISTQSTIKVDEYLKGRNSNERILVTTPGGEIGEVGELYTHMPRFTNDEEVLVFVKQNKEDLGYRVLNGEDGKMTLYRDKNGEMMISGDKKISALKNEIKNFVDKK